ncbi:MAG: toxin-antitoxin system HicB family antitoxin [Ignavibacteria bacterium]|jgi:predicted HicB family RNase H-like nuclease|nr:toxin-antitoxin system HicB family antitoxin [Ignavibacteria bacterium]MDP3831677.1 toxin-antitoxin system HicB family antitoxin [Ignavibacteriaceae bacterium]
MKKNKPLEYYLNLPYKIALHFEPGDKTWVATHPELGSGTCYAIGETIDEALQLLEEEKKFILELALNEEKEIPEPVFETEELPSGQFVLRVPKTLHKKIKDLAEKENISLNQYVAFVLSSHVGETKAFSFVQEWMSKLPETQTQNIIPKAFMLSFPNSWGAKKIHPNSNEQNPYNSYIEEVFYGIKNQN